MSFANPRKRRRYEHKRYMKHREWYLERNRKAYAAATAYTEELKKQPCERCGRHFPSCVMDFHHKKGTTKVKAVSAFRSLSQALKDEVAKCELLCANCHRIKHAEMREEGKK